MRIEKNNIKGITQGVVGSIIFYVIFQPILTYIGPFFGKVISLFFKTYSNSIYIDAATKNTNLYNSTVLTTIYGLILGIVCVGMLFAYDTAKKINRIYLSDHTSNDIKNNVSKKKVASSEKSFKGLKIALYLYILLLIFVFIFLIANYSKKQISVNIIYTFEQHLTILKPYVDENILNKLSSDWGLMQTEEDYNNISIQLNELARTNGISLPNN